jgi:hypothetical protein
MVTRSIFSILFFLSIFFGPWWVSVLLGIGLLFYAESYEVIIGGFLMDILYGAPIPVYPFQGMYFFTILFLLLFIAIFYLKGHLIFYRRLDSSW